MLRAVGDFRESWRCHARWTAIFGGGPVTFHGRGPRGINKLDGIWHSRIRQTIFVQRKRRTLFRLTERSRPGAKRTCPCATQVVVFRRTASAAGMEFIIFRASAGRLTEETRCRGWITFFRVNRLPGILTDAAGGPGSNVAVQPRFHRTASHGQSAQCVRQRTLRCRSPDGAGG